MIKIHYHSECSFFAGCENMLANFFNSEEFCQSHAISFSYVQSALYKQGFQRRVNREPSTYPIKFPKPPDISKLPNWIPVLIRKFLVAILRFFLNFPLLVYEVIVLRKLFKEINPDILHINNGGYPAARSALAAAIAGKSVGIPKIIMVVNNMATDYYHYSRWFDYPIDRIVTRSIDIFITGSQAASTRLSSVLNLPAQQVKAIHNGITLRNKTSSNLDTRKRLDLENFDGVIFGVVALLIKRKGHQVLLNSILTLIKNRKPSNGKFKILIEGNGPLRQTLVDFVTENNLTQWVTFVGDETNVVDFMSILDVLLLPSIKDEDFPNVILEAMALGKPVIASRLAGTPEQVIDNITGLLVEPGNIEQLADAMIKLIDSSQLRKTMSQAALERFNNNFNTQIALDNYSNLYKKLIEKQQ